MKKFARIIPDLEKASPEHLPGRREFLKQFAGVMVYVTLGENLLAQETVDAEAAAARTAKVVPTDFNAFLSIAADGRVTGFTGKIEMGQGVITSLAQMLADELDVPFDSVNMLMGDTDLCPWDQGTWGSMTTRFFGPLLRAAAAEARGVLLELGAEKLGVPVAQLETRDGMVCVRADRQRCAGYGELAQGRNIERHLTVKPDLKDVKQFQVMGEPMLRRDSLEKVTGRAKYTGDMRLPGMLYARILRPPAHGARLLTVDTSKASAMAGVQVVQDGDLIAVLHALPDKAAEALALIEATFDTPAETVNPETIYSHLLGMAPEGEVVAEGGDLASGRSQAAKSVETTFYDGYIAHAPIETHAALAVIEGEKATVWASTQNPFGVRDLVAEALGFPVGQVRVITPYVGGAFGGKTSNIQAVEAARLARAAGVPVQVMRTREEEFFYDTYRPAAIVRIGSGIDDSGKLTFWDYEVFYAGARGAGQFYTVPNHRTVARPRGWVGPPGSHFFATGAWRAPGNNTNAFARESQIDIMAALAGMDPVEFRLRNLEDPRMIRVLKAVAEKSGWTPAAAPSDRGLGVACGEDAGSYVAMVAEVAVDRDTGQVTVERVVCAQEMGIVINPQGATIQMEGCITMGLGYALSEELDFRGGEILTTNFNQYHIPLFSALPKIETTIVEANDIPPQGGGEPAIIIVGAAIANAIHDATGARLNRMAMTPERVLAAIKETGS
jgi:isoquinoline 1-oxidoreductase